MLVGNVFIVCVCLCVPVFLFGLQLLDDLTKKLLFWYGGTLWPYLDQVWLLMSLNQGQGHILENATLLPGHQSKKRHFCSVWNQWQFIRC